MKKILIITLALLGNLFAIENTQSNQNFKGIGVVLGSDGTNIKINDVYPNGPAVNAGIEKDDIIIKVNGIKVKSANEAKSEIIKSDDDVVLTITRGQLELVFDVDKSLFALGKVKDFEINGGITNGVYVIRGGLVPYYQCQQDCDAYTFWQEINVVENSSETSKSNENTTANEPSFCDDDKDKICLYAESPSQAFIYVGDLAGRTRSVFNYEIKVGSNVIEPPSDFIANSDDGEYVFVRLPNGTFMLK